jgi:3-hydroxyisobutyrate dehydrogenase-like beta-hydroxyacid dehydrogenase
VSAEIGLIGLGNMGIAVAARLATVGALRAYDRDPARGAQATGLDGVTVVGSVAESAAHVVVFSLPTPAASHAVLVELLPHLARGSMVIETSTVNPADAWELHRLCRERDVAFLDAAILSGVGQMHEGRSTLLVGGAEADVATAVPLFEAMAETVRHLGPVGAGMAAKVINNAVAHAVMVVLAEAGALAAATGVAAGDLVEMLKAPDAGLLRPLTHRFAERVVGGDYAGGMPTDAARKDSTLALELAQTSGVPLFAIQAAHTVYEIAARQGLGRDDYAAIARLWEQWTGRPIAEGG